MTLELKLEAKQLSQFCGLAHIKSQPIVSLDQERNSYTGSEYSFRVLNAHERRSGQEARESVIKNTVSRRRPERARHESFSYMHSQAGENALVVTQDHAFDKRSDAVRSVSQ
jgi:hypothetical protein